jgi:hypothetical protein
MTTATSASENRPHDLRRKRTRLRAPGDEQSLCHTSRSTTRLRAVGAVACLTDESRARCPNGHFLPVHR